MTKKEIPQWIEAVLMLIIAIGLAVLVYSIGKNFQQSETTTESYSLTTIVVGLHEENDTVFCEDYNNNIWMFSGIEDWQIHDVATLTMDTCGTATIYDDRIIAVRYNGVVEGWK